MSRASPSFAVVMPTHNRGPAIERAVRSVLEQTYPAKELILVDDASNPKTSMLAPFVLDEPRIRYHYLASNLGASGARNQGTRLATADFVSFLDDDDFFMPHKLAALAAAVVEDPRRDVLYHPLSVHMVREGIRYRTDPRGGEFSREELLVKNVLDGGTSMLAVRRMALLELGGFDETLPAVEDYELILRLHLAGLKFHRVDEVLTEYTRRTDQRSKTLSLDNDIRAWDLIHDKHRAAYQTLTPAMWADHLQKMEQYRAFRMLAGYRRVAAAGRFVTAFRRRPTAGALPLLVAGAVALVSPRLVMELQGKLKRSWLIRSVHSPATVSGS